MSTPSPDSGSHLHRAIAEGFGDDAERYDRTRPHYPAALAAAVLEGLPGAEVVDVGIGTGISALPFRDAGAHVRGVEADERMAALARARGFEVDVARFEEWRHPAADVDAVIAGQTWHWVDPTAGAARAGDVLRPGGRIALFWNAGDPEPGIARAFGAVYRSVDTGLPFAPWTDGRSAVHGYDAFLARAADGIRATTEFAEPRRLRFDWTATITTDAWLDQVPSNGGHSRIPADRLALLLDGLGRVVDDHGGSFTMHYATVAVVADRR
jgi:SAM-dependent methyltransferase